MTGIYLSMAMAVIELMVADVDSIVVNRVRGQRNGGHSQRPNISSVYVVEIWKNPFMISDIASESRYFFSG